MNRTGVLSGIFGGILGGMMGTAIARRILADKPAKLPTWRDDGWGDFPGSLGARRSHSGRWTR
jgi:hypothetical protein